MSEVEGLTITPAPSLFWQRIAPIYSDGKSEDVREASEILFFCRNFYLPTSPEKHHD